jgi:hypothetical protein
MIEADPGTGAVRRTVDLDGTGIDVVAAAGALWVPVRTAAVDRTGFPTMTAVRRVTADGTCRPWRPLGDALTSTASPQDSARLARRQHERLPLPAPDVNRRRFTTLAVGAGVAGTLAALGLEGSRAESEAAVLPTGRCPCRRTGSSEPRSRSVRE